MRNYANLNSIDQNEAEKHCGVGVDVSEQEINEFTEELVNKHKQKVIREGKGKAFGFLIKEAKEQLRFANQRVLSKTLNSKIAIVLDS